MPGMNIHNKRAGRSGSVILAILLAVSCATVLAQEDGRALLLQGATIIDGISDEPLSGYSVYIVGDEIRAISPRGNPVPAGAEVVDLEGKYIIPGLIEGHVHWLDWMGELFLNHGVTSVISMDNLDSELRLKSHAVDIRLPRLYHTGRGNEVLRLSNTESEKTIRETVKRYLERQPNMAGFPAYNEQSSRVFALTAKEIHKAGYLVFGHTENAELSIKAGHDVIEHVWGFVQAVMTEDELQAFQRGEHLTWATFMTGRWDQLDKIINDAVKAGAYLNPTLVYEWAGMSEHALERELEEYRVGSNPRLVYFPDYTIPGGNLKESLLAKHRQVKNFSSRYEIMPFVSLMHPDDREVFKEGYKNVLEFVRRYVAAGGKIEAGTDTISGGMPGLVLHQEMQMLVEAGITPMQALKAATRWSAELLEGKNGALGPARVGSIEPDKYADLVVLGENPLTDIWNTLKIERVMKNGRWVEPGYNPEYYSFTSPSRSMSGATFAPVINSITPDAVTAGSADLLVTLEGSGFQLTTLVKVNGISVKTRVVNPRQIEFTIPANLLESPVPNPYTSPGPFQNIGLIGYRSIEISAFSPPPEGGKSNTVNLMILPDGIR